MRGLLLSSLDSCYDSPETDEASHTVTTTVHIVDATTHPDTETAYVHPFEPTTIALGKSAKPF